MRQQQVAEDARRKRQAQQDGLADHEPDKFPAQRRLHMQQRAGQRGKQQARHDDDDPLHHAHECAGLDDAAISAVLPVVLVVNQNARHRAGHAQINQRDVTADGRDQRPQAEFRFAKVMRRQLDRRPACKKHLPPAPDSRTGASG